MTKKIIGYRGLISGEVLLYMSRILYNLGLKVLVCDCSPEKELKYVIPENSYEDRVNEHSAYAGTVDDCVEYRGIMHIDDLFEDKLIEGFDTVLINFGFADFHSKISKCSYVNYITDMDKVNIEKLLNMKSDIERERKNHLLIQNVVKGGIAAYACADRIMSKFSIDTCSIVRLNKKDIKIKSYAQYNNRFKFQDISRDLYDYLFFCIWNAYADLFDKKKILKAINAAMKGG